MSYSYRPGRPYNAKPRRQGYKRGNGGGARGVYIDPSRFIKAATFAENKPYEHEQAFADLPISQKLKDNLRNNGYAVPTPIQDQAIPPALSGKDIIGIASTGTGKTAAFALPILQHLIDDPNTYALIIAPTRELAQQIDAEVFKLTKSCGLSATVLIGGVNMGAQFRGLRYNPRIVIGTPGRIKDHLKRGTLKLGRFNLVVLDEVDRMLDMGFIDDVTAILSSTSQVRQSFFFSATMNARVQSLIERFSKDAVTVSLKAGSASENVHQDVVRYSPGADKIEQLHNLLKKNEVAKALVFDETQRGVERLSQELAARGFSVESLHGGKTQGQRKRALNMFKTNQINFLVATDVAARGIDISDITHVINYSIPKVYDDYIHRIGRAGRAGQVGYALTFVAR